MSLNKEKNFISAVVYLYNNEREVSAFLGKVNSLQTVVGKRLTNLVNKEILIKSLNSNN